VVGDERVMYNSFSGARDVDHPNGGLQIPVDRSRPGFGELSAFFCLKPSSGPGRSRELILKTAESHWWGGQREP